METGLNAFKEALHLKHVEAGEYSPLALAYIGDAVYELAIRTLWNADSRAENFQLTALPPRLKL